MPNTASRTSFATTIGSVVSERRRELLILSGILFGLFTLVSMVGWQVEDPTLLRPGEGATSNPCGPIGANLSDLAFALFGHGAWALVGLVSAAVLALAGRKLMSIWQWCAVLGLFQVFMASVQLVVASEGPHASGGALGYWTLVFLETGVGRIGAGFVLFAIGILLATVVGRIQWTTVAHRTVQLMESRLPVVRRWVGVAVAAVAGWIRVGGWRGAGWLRGFIQMFIERSQRSVRRMWSSLRRQDGEYDYDTTWADEVWETDAALPLDEVCPPSAVPSDPGDTVVSQEQAVQANVQWEVTSPSQKDSVAKRDVLGLFPDFSARQTVIEQLEPSVIQPTSGMEHHVAEHTEEASAAPEQYRGDAVASPASSDEGISVAASAYLDMRVEDDGKAFTFKRFHTMRSPTIEIHPPSRRVK